MAQNDEIDIIGGSDAPKRSKCGSFMHFLYNSEKGAFMGRTGASWAKIGIFYVFFYAGLASFFAIMLAIFMQTVNRDKPTYTLDSSLLKSNPGMGFRPMPDFETTLIRFVKRNKASYKEYTDNLETFLKPYDNRRQSSDSTELRDNCDLDNKDTKPLNAETACMFNLEKNFENECTHSGQYGYNDGKPCVILKLNKVYGWEPETYKVGDTIPDDMPDSAFNQTQVLDFGSVGVSCEGINPADKENMGKLSFFPKHGFAKAYFPFLNQKDYRQPLVAVRFDSITNGVLVMVRCRAWAKNIENERFNEKDGAIHFEMLVD